MGQSHIVFTAESTEAVKQELDNFIGMMSMFEDYPGGDISANPKFSQWAKAFFKEVLPKLHIEFQSPSKLHGTMHSEGFKESIDAQIKEMADRWESPKSTWDKIDCFVSSIL